MTWQKQHNWANWPFSPGKFPFFYGWIMVIGSVIAVLASIPGQTMGVGVFSESWVKAWGLDRLQLSIAYMCGTIVSSFILPFAGAALDRYGSRVMIVASSLGLGGSLLAISYAHLLMPEIQSTATFIAVFLLAVALFLLLRFFGQGCLALVSRVVIGRWFNRYRGRAAAIAGVFAAFGFNSSPILLNELVQRFGWQGACLILAATIGLGVASLGWLFFRDNPAQCGLSMDGAPMPTDEELRQGSAFLDIRHEFNRVEAIKTIPFWAFSLGLSSHGLIMTGVTFHIASLGGEMGLTETESFSVFWPMAFFGVAFNLGCGWLADRTKLRYLLMGMMVAELVGAYGVLHLGDWYGRALMVVGYGAAGGFFSNLVTVTWPRFFGQLHLGAISGLNMSVMVFASALGPVFLATGYAFTGSYRGVMGFWMIFPLAILILAIWARNPQETYPKGQAARGGHS